MNNPTISVLMPVYNGEQYIQEAIKSILYQTYQHFEFIIINDGSTDASETIIRSYDDPRIVYLKNEKNLRIVQSLNKGLNCARGRYIARMDADDISMPTRLQIQFEFMENHPDFGICGTYVETFGENQKSKIWNLPVTDEEIRTEMLFSSPFAHPSVMIRKSLLEEHNILYDETYLHAEDYALWTHIARFTRMANIPIPLLKYRIVPGSATRLADAEYSKRHRVIKKIYQPFLDTLSIINTPREDLIHFILTVNTRIQENPLDFHELSAYFDKLLAANTVSSTFNHACLKRLLGKKWVWNLYYSFKIDPLKSLGGIFSHHFLYGLNALYHSKMK